MNAAKSTNHLALLIGISLVFVLFDTRADTANSLLGFAINQGAAEGYIEDIACRSCHPTHWDSFQHVGMSKSFVKPQPSNFIENFDAPDYFHQVSKRYYKISKKKDELIFKRYQLDNNKQQINVFERKIDWILGSGNKTRSYLYQTELGEIYQLPLGWYSETQNWLMSPGYDNKFHNGIKRIIKRECLFCHNAYPDVESGSDSHWQAHAFPKKLPEGIGCQRCHGPGSLHIKSVLKGEKVEAIKSAITNPAKLEIDKRDSVCFQCHLLPAVAMIGVRYFDRADYSFRAGELISDYILSVDIDDPQLAKSERFEINHHAYRLRQSKCFKESAGELTCISCHNPHKKVTQQDRVKHYGKVCLSCHKEHAVEGNLNPKECTSCHMPKRRTQDVVHVVMTDHKIQKHAAKKTKRLGPLTQKEPIISGVEFLIPEHSPSGKLAEIYQSVTLLRALVTESEVDHLEQLMADTINEKDPAFPALMDLASGQIALKRYTDAEKTLNTIMQSQASHPKVLEWLATVYSAQNKYTKSEKLFKKALSFDQNIPEVHTKLGLLYFKQNKLNLAVISLSKATSLRPNMFIAWYYLAAISANSNQLDDAVEYYKRVLGIEPSFTSAYLKLSETLLRQNNPIEAKRYLKHGVNVIQSNQSLIDALNKIK